VDLHFGRLTADPLYSFLDEGPLENKLLALFNNYLSPLLAYLEDLYSAPIGFTGDRPSPIFYNLFNNDGKFAGRNFKYTKTQKIGLKTLKPWTSLARILTGYDMISVKDECTNPKWYTTPIYLCTLEVTIPSNSEHRFFAQDYIGYQWDMGRKPCERVIFTVQRYGDTGTEAQCNAALRAMDIITFLRSRPTLTHLPVSSTSISTVASESSQGFILAKKLHQIWKLAYVSFLNDDSEKDFWSFAKLKLDTWALEFKEFQLVLKYYQVS